MIILPAIDLIAGRCVRLYQGDYEQKTVYGDSLQTALGFQAAGAKYLHVVDLDGAKNPQNAQRALIKDIAAKTKLSVQTGGGIRQAQQIEDYLDNGVARVIIGSLAATNPALVKGWIARYGAERIVLSLDVAPSGGDYLAALHGWQEKSAIKLADLLAFYAGIKGVQILSTDISKDGSLRGPNIALYKQIKATAPDCFLQASGGVSALSDIEDIKTAGCQGVIIGKALYEDKIDLKQALTLGD